MRGESVGGLYDLSHREFGGAHYEIILYPDDHETLVMKPTLLGFIALLLFFDGVRWPVDLDDNSALETNKVCNIITDWNLTTKLQLLPARPQGAPDDRLRFYGVAALDFS